MRPLYISLFALVFAVISTGCSGMPDLKDPHSLSSRVGNFSPAKLENEKAERKAAKLVTPLEGSKDLDGREGNFNPSFGAPEATPSASGGTQKAPVGGKTADSSSPAGAVKPAPAQFNPAAGKQFGAPESEPTGSPSPTGNDKVSQSQRFAQLGDGRSSAPASSTKSSKTGVPGNVTTSVSPAQFGMSEDGRATSFTTTRSTTPITELPPSTAESRPSAAELPPSIANGTPQGIGCPPAGMSSLRTFGRQNSYAQPRSSYVPPQRSSPTVMDATAFRTAPPSAQPVPRQYSAPTQVAGAPATTPLIGGGGDSDVINAQNQRARDVQVKITARVKRLLPDDRKGNPHQRFLLELSNGTTVLVAHNIDLAPYVPLQQGDMVTICGEYIWNEKGGVLHYTHHTTNSRHRGGYIEYNRQTYQ